MTLRGSLDELPLADVIQLFGVSKRTGVVELEFGRTTGQIYLRHGQIVHATTDGLVGEEALFQLVAWSTGEFRFAPEVAAPSTTITKDNDNLLIEAAHRIDQSAPPSVEPDLGELVPVLCPGAESFTHSLSPEHWNLICWIDGRRTFAEISLALGQAPRDLAPLVHDLVAWHRVELHEDTLCVHRQDLVALTSTRLRHLIDLCDAQARRNMNDPAALDRNLRLCHEEARRGRALDALYDLVRGHGRVISEALGAAARHSYLATVTAILSRELA